MASERPGFIERNFATIRNAAGLGFLALTGAAILAPGVAAYAAGIMNTLGLTTAGSHFAHNAAKNHRINNH